MKKSISGVFSLLILAFSALMQSCGSDSFKIDGVVTGADRELISLQRPGFNGEWVTIDSVRTDADGGFSISSPAPESPEIYRVSLNDRSIYFPVDSIEHISLNTSLAGFGTDYTLDGSEKAKKMCAFDKELLKVRKSGNEALAGFKKRVVNEIILPSKGDIVAYYIITKGYGEDPLFSVENPEDAGIFGAVATSFAQYRPDDSRNALLEKLALEARRNRNRKLGRKNVMEAREIAMIDIKLPDVKDKQIALSSLTGKGRKVAVIFSPLNEKDSPEVNRRLAALYQKYSQGVEFYQVCPDVDIIAWREAAENLPWVVVNDADGVASQNIRNYNVTRFPAFYIYSADGELVSSASDIEDFGRKLSLF